MNTNPGYYKVTNNNNRVLIGQVINSDEVLWFESFDSEDYVEDLIRKGWSFTRLVPAEELMKAYIEGQEDGLKLANGANTEYREWSTSRAWRVAEGLE